ncbi:MAG: glycosyltransferase family 2 protein [Myxococcota bacterium]|nr:glycosyltransferase family 2 protein [Myxococcota bacterium]
MSVVVAAYGRPDVLAHALRSALAQTLPDLEVVVVGDAAGRETADVVASLDDPRLRHLDMPLHYGEQSGPNNVGAARARGDLLAFLNQDDLWLPDHLAVALAWLEATGSDLVLARGAMLRPGEGGAPARREDQGFRLTGVGRDGRYDPLRTYAPASTWLLRRALHERLRGWRPALECHGESSRDFLVRAWRGRARMRIVPHVSVAIVQSAPRPGAYLGAPAHEHDALAAAIRVDPEALRRRILDRATEPPDARRREPWSGPLRRALVRAGVHPFAVRRDRRARLGRGVQIARLRRRRGLPPLLRSGADVAELRLAHGLRHPRPLSPGDVRRFGADGDAEGLRLRGWAQPAAGHCETRDATAELLLVLAKTPTAPVGLRVRGKIVRGRALHVSADGATLATWHRDPGGGTQSWRTELPPGVFSVRHRHAVVRLHLTAPADGSRPWRRPRPGRLRVEALAVE